MAFGGHLLDFLEVQNHLTKVRGEDERKKKIKLFDKCVKEIWSSSIYVQTSIVNTIKIGK